MSRKEVTNYYRVCFVSDLHTLKYLEDKVQIWEQYEIRANEVFRHERFFYDPKTMESFLHRFVRLVFEVNGKKSILLWPKTENLFLLL